jgi:serine/threonine protein kinase
MTVSLSAQTAVEGRYLLDAPLEGWGLGEAWLCRDKNFRNRPVVLEFLPVERSDRLAEVAQELRAQRALKHPHVLPVINQGTYQGRAWVAYDGWDGVPLPRLLDEQRRTRGMLDAATVHALFGKVLDALAAAHEAATPVLHGCLQPACVIVKERAVKVIDFGLLAFYTPAAFAPFAAPELMVDGAAPTIASDVYALGATLAEMLLPSQGVVDARRGLEVFLRALGREGVQVGRMQRSDVALSLWDVVARAIRPDPAARWDDVSAFRTALDAAWDAAPVAPARPLAEAPAMPAPTPPVSAPFALAGPAFSSAALPLGAPPSLSMAPVAPAAVFGPSSTVASAPASAVQASVPSRSAWEPSLPSAPMLGTTSGDAWKGAPAALRTDKPVDTSAWDPPGDGQPSGDPWSAFAMGPQGPGVSTVHALGAADEWEEKTKAAEPPQTSNTIPRSKATQEATMALDVDALATLSPPLKEATMALDMDAFAEAAQRRSARRVAALPQEVSSDEDWKDSVVLLDTTSGNAEAPAPFGSEDEPGARTQMAPLPAAVLETMETLQPRRVLPASSPIHASGPGQPLGPDAGVVYTATVPAPMAHGQVGGPPSPERAMYRLPPAHRPPAGRGQGTAPPSSKIPIVVATAVSLLLVGGAVLFVLLR